MSLRHLVAGTILFFIVGAAAGAAVVHLIYLGLWLLNLSPASYGVFLQIAMFVALVLGVVSSGYYLKFALRYQERLDALSDSGEEDS